MKRVLILSLLLGPVSVWASGETALQAKVRQICAPQYWDAMTPDTRLEQLADLEEPGRQALEALARVNDATGTNALDYLRELEDERAVPIARAILNDPNASEDRLDSALLVIDSFGDAASLDRVLEIFRTGSGDLQGRAAAALGAIGDQRGLAVLRAAVADPAYQRIGATVIKAIGVKGHEQAVDLLVSEGQRVDPASLLLDDVITSLGNIETQRSRAAAMGLLGRVPRGPRRGRLIQDLFRSFFSQRYESQDPVVRAEIKAYLDELRSDPSAPEDIKTHPDDPPQ